MPQPKPNDSDPTYGQTFVDAFEQYLKAHYSCEDNRVELLAVARKRLEQEVDDIVNLIPETLADLT